MARWFRRQQPDEPEQGDPPGSEPAASFWDFWNDYESAWWEANAEELLGAPDHVVNQYCRIYGITRQQLFGYWEGFISETQIDRLAHDAAEFLAGAPEA